MELPRNSVWEFKDSDLAEDGLYRILEIMLDVTSIILFPLNTKSVTTRPFAISIQVFTEHVKSRNASKADFNLPSFLLVAEENIAKEHITRRDKNYSLIEGIISDRVFIFDYATKKRVSHLAKHAKKVGIDRKALSRLLMQYWRYGQDKMALLPAYNNSGGFGKDKKPTDKPLGAPKQPRTMAVERSVKYITTDIDKSKFKKALKKYYLKQAGLTLSKTYKNMLIDSYADEVRIANACCKPPVVPTLKQFSYWSNKILTKDELIKSRCTENDHLRNKRGLLGSVIQDSYLPGAHFEIDATVADVHIVSELGSQYILGRPTIYIVVDRASRMIVGMHVSLFHASWRAARQALSNCFLPKSCYSEEFGVNIDDSEWPCSHIPKDLVCDNGEMIGLQPKKALNPMTKLSFTPPYRPDCKGVVEKRFDILNKEVIHEFLGTTRGGNIIRGSRDPRKDAIYTLKEVTAEIIKAVLEHNKSIFSDLAFSSPLLVENDLSPTPINYWKIHLAKHKHELQAALPHDVISRLLPPTQVSMTRNGIHFNGLYYSNKEIEERNLASIARSSGQWKLEARIDENTTNHIYVKLDKNKDFELCYLSPRSRMFKDKSMYESEFIQDWLDSKKELTPISVTSIDDHQSRHHVTKNAKERSNNAEKIAFSEKTKNVRQRREDELQATTNVLQPKIQSNKNIDTTLSGNSSAKIVSLPVGRKRKTKGGSS
ncbi:MULTISPECIES: DDE-type integrase/transposase/recombinase [unclassified Pseudoalteromonas]|uniref:DDE-type integrase/transposase/recombinase n=1 Tax=unclassified Pseudoalteromonas TaxID=194690 RepID=UPI0015FEFB6D|nr:MULTISPECIES: DDE-type integrase/transposase/recombinase [unclassified Pseudoalteromonas]MBB1348960.1 DDE-type integrase/transposase/recombinase [Pseudoalteromonas sp. SG45-3]MBB1357029.1 DDE-type integrase/transposase/recombinase [Pseudoalteromonas sp. SG45-6]